MKNNSSVFTMLILVSICFVTEGCAEDAAYRSIEESVPTISVQGMGKIVTEPDEAIVRFGVTSTEKTLKKAYQNNTNSTNDVIKAVKSMGISSKDMKTSSYSVMPEYPKDEKGRRVPGKPVSFRVSQQLTIKIRDLSMVGEVIDKTIENGTNVFNGIQFASSNIKELQKAAKIEAAKDAKEKAGTIAEALGVSAGRVIRVKEFSAQPYPGGNRYAFETMSAKTTPSIEAGSMEVTATCDVIYEIVQ